MRVAVASASLARPVMPTAVPTAAFSATVLAAALVSVTAPMSNSSTSLTLIVNTCVGERAVGRSGADRDVVRCAVRFAIDALPATVTTPVLASMANRPPALSVQRVGDRVGRGVRVGGRGRDADQRAVRGVLVTALAAALVSLTAPTSNSSTSLIVIVNAVSAVEPSAEVARTVMLCDAAVSRSSSCRGHRDHARVGVDREPAAGVVVQRVGDRVGGGIRVAGHGRDADRRAVGRVLVDRVGRGVAVAPAPSRRTRRHRRS